MACDELLQREEEGLRHLRGSKDRRGVSQDGEIGQTQFDRLEFEDLGAGEGSPRGPLWALRYARALDLRSARLPSAALRRIRPLLVEHRSAIWNKSRKAN